MIRIFSKEEHKIDNLSKEFLRVKIYLLELGPDSV